MTTNITLENITISDNTEVMQAHVNDVTTLVTSILVTNPFDGQILQYDGSTGKWINKSTINTTATTTVIEPSVTNDTTTIASTDSTTIPTETTTIDTVIPEVIVEATITSTVITETSSSITKDSPIITFIDDDGKSESYTRIYPIFKSKSVSATFGLVTDWVGNSGFITIPQIKQLQAEGFDFTSHSKTHSDSIFNSGLASTSDSSLEAEFSVSKQWFIDNGLGEVDTIVYPFANFDTHAGSGQATRVEALANKYYTYGVNADGWYNNLPINNMYIRRYFPDFTCGETLDSVKNVIDCCISEKGWLIFGVHSFNNLQFPDDKLEAIIDYIKSKGVDILNFKDAIKYKTNTITTTVSVSSNVVASNVSTTSVTSTVNSSVFDTTGIAEGFWLGNWASSSLGNIATLVNTIGRTPKIIHTFINSNHAFNAFNGTMDYIDSCGCTNMLTMELIKADNTQYNTVDVNNGLLDSYFTTIATALKTWKNGKEILFRLMHECNGTWYGWCISDGTINTNESYINAYRRIVNIFRSVGATNVKFIYNVNNSNCGTNSSFMGAYPSDEYVDYISIDGYNWGISQSWGSKWESFDEVFSASYQALTSVSNKPVLICEYASTELGGDKASWIQDSMVQMKSEKYNKIKGAIWFNENKETNWKIDSSENALNAYKSLVF